ncbi:hypothetical protein C8J56DRAFT_1159526 [Mycena floridula]|nr:hypothetical protein C8J56DRAFT_1159526 [Mycena floridula]
MGGTGLSETFNLRKTFNLEHWSIIFEYELLRLGMAHPFYTVLGSHDAEELHQLARRLGTLYPSQDIVSTWTPEFGYINLKTVTLNLHISTMHMKYPALLSFVTLATNKSPVLDTVCYGSGTEADCSTYIDTFCNSIGNINNVRVDYQDTTSRCFTLDPESETKCDFSAVNLKAETFGVKPNLYECKAALKSIGRSCNDLGGTARFEGETFRFEMDPNTGACSERIGN